MREFLFKPDALKAIATVLILLAAVYGFVSEGIPPDLVSLLALLALLVLGILSPGEAFSDPGAHRPVNCSPDEHQPDDSVGCDYFWRVSGVCYAHRLPDKFVYGPGGYRARDFIKMGLVLDLLLAIIALVLIPYYWPLR